jgi:wyosine [tRNA(Phe)-imidazoG37] synthetase (radical SAM superfamily)
MSATYDRFNLEEEIQNVWQTKDDLNAITERIYEDLDGPMTDDEISNVLIGLSELHETRCKKLWKVFETMVHEKCFDNPLYQNLDYKGKVIDES